jgi:cyclopropane fatty-acyl-phospholipid synthase-like methyltransferase
MSVDNWEKAYQEAESVWGINPDRLLLQYAPLIPMGQVLDLGMGEGRNALFFAKRGYPVRGIDLAPTAVQKCKEQAALLNVPIQAEVGTIVDAEIPPQSHSLVISTMALQFIKRSESQALLERIKSGLMDGGLVYLTVFSTDDPSYLRAKKSSQEIEPNTFYHEARQQVVHFFEKDEILSQFSDFKLIYFAQEIVFDSGHPGAPEPHYHGILVYLGQKCD